MEQLISVKAIDSALRAKAVFCKFLSANDSGETGGHQSGILISKSAKNMLFSDYELEENHILKKLVRIRWQDELFTDSCFTWYESKNELRVTKFGRGFPLIRPEKTGALFVLSKLTNDEYEAFVLNTEEEIQQFLDAFGLSPADTNRPVEISRVVPEIREKSIMDQYLASLVADFPTSSEMARAARWIQSEVNHNEGQIKTDPDKIVLSWTNQEYRLFRAIEQSKYGEEILRGFTSVEDFIVLANQVLNRRKSRAGKSLEHHLSAIFDGNNLRYSAQGVTEGNKKPDLCLHIDYPIVVVENA